MDEKASEQRPERKEGENPKSVWRTRVLGRRKMNANTPKVSWTVRERAMLQSGCGEAVSKRASEGRGEGF